MNLAIIGFILIIILMFVLIGEKMSPPMAFIILPLIAAVVSGASIADISLYVNDGLASILNTAVLFLFSISFFTLMSEQGLFDPLVDFVISKVGNKITAIFIAVLLVSTVAHLDGSGASTYLIAIPAFKPIMDKLGVKPVVFLGTVTGLMAAMNIIPWGGPTIRAASVAGVEVSDLYSFILPAVVVMFLLAIINAVINSRRKREGSVDGNINIVDLAGDVTSEPKTSKGLYIYNLVVTLIMLALLFIDTGLPMHFIFMVAYAFAILGNFRSVKEQGKKIQEYGNNAIVMTMTLFAVGIFIGVIEGSGMVEAMATTIINALPEFIAPHTHWFLALFSVPLMMVLGTDAFYFALLPIVIGIVEPFGISASTVAATFLITGTYGTYISPTVAANYVGVSLAGTTIGEHIKANLPIMWAASIITLIAATLLGVVQF
ncbi:citrate transporter [Aerococcaceae bacterium INB8]|uniref:Citrate transporter n=1 Tax=Ruoffia halotolerans TaxID=2748684 RepID=A0A839A3E1_9LACT|nr:SLC13 family permease [Ruoffia halotolerans]MBA5728370.1 citrate transporter [Ruoffia halotolerans]